MPNIKYFKPNLRKHFDLMKAVPYIFIYEHSFELGKNGIHVCECYYNAKKWKLH